MMISEFARAAGLSPDTVRFYVKRGLLRPEMGRKGGSNPYHLFSSAHLDMVRLIRAAQSLGFTLREIAAINDVFQKQGLGRRQRVGILRDRLTALDEKAAEIGRMTSYMRAKIAWMEAGESGPEPALERAGGETEVLACGPDEIALPSQPRLRLGGRNTSAMSERAAPRPAR